MAGHGDTPPGVIVQCHRVSNTSYARASPGKLLVLDEAVRSKEAPGVLRVLSQTGSIAMRLWCNPSTDRDSSTLF